MLSNSSKPARDNMTDAGEYGSTGEVVCMVFLDGNRWISASALTSSQCPNVTAITKLKQCQAIDIHRSTARQSRKQNHIKGNPTTKSK
jgi:hypothetical protein